MNKIIKNILYPTNGTVNKNYTKFLLWSSISNTIISIQSTLSTHEMLSIIGKSDNDYSMSMNYMSKEIFGQLGGLLILNTFSSNIDNNIKKYKNRALFLQHIALFIETITPLIPSYFIPMSSISNICKNICWPYFGSINAKAIQKLSDGTNLSEIYTKISVFNTLGSTIGMTIGLFIISNIQDYGMRLCLYPILTSIRIYSFNKSLKYSNIFSDI